MKRQLYALLFLASFALSLYAQKTDVTEANLRASIEYLASDKLEGRRTGEPGANLAATYIACRFAKYGLVPVVENGRSKPGYKQVFPYNTGVRLGSGNQLDLNLVNADNTQAHKNLYDATAGHLYRVSDEPPGGSLRGPSGSWMVALPVGFSPNGSAINAPVSFAGYGIVSKEAQFDDYSWHGRPIDFKGDVVLVFDGGPDNDNPHSPYARFDLRTKALIAKEHGAVGMLVITRESVFLHDRLTRMEYDQSLGEAAIPIFVISRETARQILGYPNEASLKTAEELSADKAEGANTNIGFRDVQPHLTFSVNLVKKSVDAYNVVGVLRGTDPQLKNEAIVIGAHYDHLGHGGAGSLAVNSTAIHHGADDNASGTAAIIELARRFAAKHDNKRTLIF
ncbi:MAG TPA: M28 family peptidase, partial [Pyrinomonadaceae bacterium]